MKDVRLLSRRQNALLHEYWYQSLPLSMACIDCRFWQRIWPTLRRQKRQAGVLQPLSYCPLCNIQYLQGAGHSVLRQTRQKPLDLERECIQEPPHQCSQRKPLLLIKAEKSSPSKGARGSRQKSSHNLAICSNASRCALRRGNSAGSNIGAFHPCNSPFKMTTTRNLRSCIVPDFTSFLIFWAPPATLEGSQSNKPELDRGMSSHSEQPPAKEE